MEEHLGEKAPLPTLTATTRLETALGYLVSATVEVEAVLSTPEHLNELGTRQRKTQLARCSQAMGALIIHLRSLVPDSNDSDINLEQLLTELEENESEAPAVHDPEEDSAEVISIDRTKRRPIKVLIASPAPEEVNSMPLAAGAENLATETPAHLAEAFDTQDLSEKLDSVEPPDVLPLPTAEVVGQEGEEPTVAPESTAVVVEPPRPKEIEEIELHDVVIDYGEEGEPFFELEEKEPKSKPHSRFKPLKPAAPPLPLLLKADYMGVVEEISEEEKALVPLIIEQIQNLDEDSRSLIEGLYGIGSDPKRIKTLGHEHGISPLEVSDKLCVIRNRIKEALGIKQFPHKALIDHHWQPLARTRSKNTHDSVFFTTRHP